MNTDKEATKQVAGVCFGEGVYFRDLSKEEKVKESQEKELIRLGLQVVAVIEQANKQLSLPLEFVADLSLILSVDGFESAAVTRFDSAGVIHRVLLFSQFALGDQNHLSVENANSRMRHEYLHLLDDYLGQAGKHFSEEMAHEIIAIVDRNLFDNQKILSLVDEATIKCEDRDALEQASSERILFSNRNSGNNVVLPGHPSDNVRELFVSVLNSFLDPRFQKVLAAMSEPERTKINNMCDEIMALVEKRIKQRI